LYQGEHLSQIKKPLNLWSNVPLIAEQLTAGKAGKLLAKISSAATGWDRLSPSTSS
jgi:hypothetical protein